MGLIATGTTMITRKAKDGEKGAALRTRRWKMLTSGSVTWQSGAEGEEFLDIAIFENTSTKKAEFYQCIKSHTQTTVSYNGNDTLKSPAAHTDTWKLFEDYEAIATDLLLADKAYIKNLLLNYATAEDADGNTTIEIDGTTGKLTAKGADIEGSVTAATLGRKKGTVSAFATIGNTNFVKLNMDGSYYIVSYVQKQIYLLPQAKDYEGVSVTLVSFTGDASLYLSISADNGTTSTEYKYLETGFACAKASGSGLAYFNRLGMTAGNTVTVMSVRRTETSGNPSSDWTWIVTDVVGYSLGINDATGKFDTIKATGSQGTL